MRINRCMFAIILVLAGMTNSISQPCTTIGQTPSTAFPVCGTSTFSQSTVPLCNTALIPTMCTNAVYGDVNPYYYKFTCYTAGTIGFVLSPINVNDDYDWVLFDITGRNPNDIYTDISLNIAENWSAFTGNTGAAGSTNPLRNCAGSTPNFSSMPTLIVGHQYLLMVSNWSASQLGYSLTFTGGTAVITDPLLPALQNASIDCDGLKITVRLNKKMKCSSLATNGSDFIISPAGTIASVSGYGCTGGFDMDSVLITLSAPLPPGNYTIALANGTDGNTLLDYCNTPILVGNNVAFTVNPPIPLPMGTVSPPPCTPGSITLNFAEPIKCNSIAANGSDFIVTGPSTVTVISATAVNCNANGETTSVTVNFSTPILVTGNYNVQIATGTDGNTLTGQCNRSITTGATSTFTLAAQPPLPLGTITPPSCSPSSVTINFPEAFDCTSFSPDGSEFVITGPSAVTVVSASSQCNTDPNNRSITVNFASPITVNGTYQLQVRNGTDGNTIRGNCNRYITVGDFTTFTVPDAFPVAMDSLVPIACSPSSLKLVFASPIKCSSIAGNGSDFSVTGPSAVTIASATATCDPNGLTTSINIQLGSPIVVGGTYQLQLANGSDGNTLLSDCNRPTPVGSTLTFTASDTVSAEFQYQVQYDCTTDVIDFSHDGQHNVNQWTWTVNGAAAGTSQSITQSFSASSQNTIQLVVSNGVCSDTYSANIVLDNKVTVDLDVPELVCPGDSVIITNKSTGQIDFWQWSFGNGNNSTVKDPFAQIYPFTGVETLYSISLTAGNNNGCQATATKTIKVAAACVIAVPSAFTPNNDGLNDYLYPLNAFKAEKLDFKVFNRWGQLVFHSNDWTKKWDGTVNGVTQATGVYIWMLDYTNKDTKQKFSMKGTTTLIR